MTDRFPPLASQEELDHEDLSEVQNGLRAIALVILASLALIVCGVGYLVWRVVT